MNQSGKDHAMNHFPSQGNYLHSMFDEESSLGQNRNCDKSSLDGERESATVSGNASTPVLPEDLSFHFNCAEFLQQDASQRTFVLKDSHEETMRTASNAEGGNVQGCSAHVSPNRKKAGGKNDCAPMINSMLLKRNFPLGRERKYSFSKLKPKWNHKKKKP